MIFLRERDRTRSTPKKYNTLFLHVVEENQLICLAGDVDRVQPCASVEARKRLEPGVAGEGYKPVYSVDRA